MTSHSVTAELKMLAAEARSAQENDRGTSARSAVATPHGVTSVRGDMIHDPAGSSALLRRSDILVQDNANVPKG